MRNLVTLIVLVGLASCGGSGGGSDPAPIANVPTVNPGDTNCNGDVSFNTVVPDSSTAVDSSESNSASVNDSMVGIGNPAVSKAVDAANFQGLKIIRMERVDNSTIIATCGSTINIGGDPVTTNNSGVPNG